MSHNLPQHRDRLKNLTGFSGSSGYTVINAQND